jgi:hypothetical protein
MASVAAFPCWRITPMGAPDAVPLHAGKVCVSAAAAELFQAIQRR